MTPKEKAKELVGKYYVTIYHTINQQQKAKECATLLVDEILNSTPSFEVDKINYCIEVKQEIENL